MEPINLYLGEESRLVIEGFDSDKEASKSSYENSIFKDSYNKAFSVILDIAQNVMGKKKKGENDPSLFFRQTADSVKNNVVAFLGDRGTGKTSCMLSVANMLRKIDDCPSCAESATKIKDICKEGGFEILETIDPSYFDNKTNILEIVLGRLFTKFNDRVNKGNLSDDPNYDSKKENLFEQFQRVKESLAQMKSKECICEDDNVEGLLKLTASVNMRNDIQMLVTQYLEFVSESFLVVPIDDLDMHTEHAYEMAEQIRKYLKQPNVIVLMALKLEQLEQAIELRNRNHYDKMIGKSISESEISDMSLKYVIKLIPESNRIYMPESKVWSECVVNVFVEDVNGSVGHNGKKWKIEDDRHREETVKYYITSMIFQKTRYLFYHSKGVVNPIVPRNLRELRQLIEMLCNMKNYSKDTANRKNQILFKNYFLNTWAANNLSSKGNSLINEIFSISDVSIINKIVVKRLIEYFSVMSDADKHNQQSYNVEPNEKELLKIIEEKNVACNISLGDVLYFVRKMENFAISYEDRAFLFAIKTFYSIRLYEYYDMRTEYGMIQNADNLKKCAEYSIKKGNQLDELWEYEVLVGGSFVNIMDEDQRLISPRTGKNIRRDLGKILLKEFEDLDFSNDGENEKNISKIQWLEFLLMFVSRRDYSSEENADLASEKYRTRNEISYNSKISTGKYIFDVSSLFFNLTNLERQYNRYNENFCRFVTKEGVDSLYNGIREYCRKREVFSQEDETDEQKDNHKMLSWVSIRNIDVLEELFYVIKYSSVVSKSDDERSKSEDKLLLDDEDLTHILNFLVRVKDFNIKSYDLDECIQGKKYHEINFKFVEVLINFIDRNSKNFDCFKNVFDTLESIDNSDDCDIEAWNKYSRKDAAKILEKYRCTIDELSSKCPFVKGYEIQDVIENSKYKNE